MHTAEPHAAELELIGARTGNCLRVALPLEEAGLGYAVRHLNLRDGEQRSPSHLHLNPAGKVPTLIDRRSGATVTVSQSNAILLHLARSSPGRLLPEDAGPHALSLERFFYFITDVIGPSHAAFRARAAGDVAAAERLDQAAMEALASADAFPGPKSFMAGDGVTLADIAAFTIATVYWSALDLPRLPGLVSWYRQMEGRPSFQRGMRAFDYT